MATTTAKIDPSKLPPSERAARFHALRVHLQVFLWKNLSLLSIDAKSWDWKSVNNLLLTIQTDEEPAPESLLKFVRCKCKLGTRNLWHEHLLLQKKLTKMCATMWTMPR